MTNSMIPGLIASLYGMDEADHVERRLRETISKYRGTIHQPADTGLSERDCMLITYGDQVQTPGKPHLKTLELFLHRHVAGLISSVHILPFYPWSSDDGFSVKDYRSIDPALGDWKDVEQLAKSFRLMFDAVINHASAQGDWFKAFLRDELPYRNYFMTVNGNPDLSKVIRPRALPLLTEFQTPSGPRRVWTTFSADQVDLDFHNPDVLLEIIDILLGYAARGAQFIRLDAIAFLWKEPGTTCLHLPQTHAVVRLIRAILEETAPHVRIITETNVPHSENISYFGDGTNEAHLVYNFALPPLILHTLRTGNATALSNWVSTLKVPSEQTTFFNFLASHDGIGLNPVRGILSQEEIDGLIQQTLEHGGLISYKDNPDGTQSPYEMNINYFDALSNPQGHEPIKMQVDRFMASQAIMLSLRGLPGIYFHSLFGSRGWKEGVQLTGRNRTINRQKLDLDSLEDELSDLSFLRSMVFSRYTERIHRRASSPAFNPYGIQEVLDHGKSIFAIKRVSPDGKHSAICLQNVTNQAQTTGRYHLSPYQSLWIIK
ncbi:MAG: sugar phosphorylase [Chloroflexi bacterium]|nr:sugar phosphorylase [Chloroflexota bacterium]BCY16390.1 sucrose phosphorylase [Leptolinea sp. HRD-7]